MLFYLVVFAIILLLFVLKTNKNNVTVVLGFMVLILLYGCRDYGGLDDLTYITAFQNANEGNVVYGMEKSYIYISKWLGFLGFNYKALFFLYAFTAFVFLYLAYKNLCKTKNEWIITFLGFLVFSFLPTITIMRQFTAAAILTYALTIWHFRKSWASLFWISLASLVHAGAIIGFMFIPLFSIKLRLKTMITIPILCLIIGYAGWLNLILKYVSFLIPSKYVGYLAADTTPTRIHYVTTVVLLLYLLQLALRINKNNISSDGVIEFLERAQMFYLSLYLITLSNGWINRVSVYFILFLPFIFKTFMARISRGESYKIIYIRKITYIAFYGTYIIMFLYQMVTISETDMSTLIPYHGSLRIWGPIQTYLGVY